MASYDEQHSDYMKSLSGLVYQRYIEKISLIGSRDPYAIKSSEWSEDHETLPGVTSIDITNYLVFTKSFYTQEQFKAYKSLDAYRFFTSGWVLEVKSLKINDHTVISGKVSVLICIKKIYANYILKAAFVMRR